MHVRPHTPPLAPTSAAIRAAALLTTAGVLAWVSVARAQDRAEGAETSAPPPLTLRYGVLDPPMILEQDITTRHETSIHPLDPAPMPLECSSVCWAGRLVMTSDRHGHVLFTMPLDVASATLEPGLPEPQQVIENERRLLDDAEAIAARPHDGRWRLYVMCSMSSDTAGDRRPKRQHFARIEMDRAGRMLKQTMTVLEASVIRDALQSHLDVLQVKGYTSFDADRGKNTPRWGSVEGITWAPNGDTLLCGMRNPLAGDDAMLFTVEGVDQAFDGADASKLRVTDLFRLDLGGRGVTDLAWDPVSRGYLVTAALSNGPKLSNDQPYPLEHLDSALYWWSGQKPEPPVMIAKMAGLNIDGVCRVGESPYLALTSDEGDVSEGREGRQSILMLLAYPYPASREGAGDD